MKLAVSISSSRSWPTVTALQSGASTLTAYLAATYTIVVGVAATFAGAQLAPKMTDIMKHHDGPAMTAAKSKPKAADGRRQAKPVPDLESV